MKKIFLLFAILLLSTPTLALADDGPQFTCFSPKLNTEEMQEYIKGGLGEYYDIKNEVRGTCREIEISTVVSLDPALRGDYLLGEHGALGIEYDRYPTSSKYSEFLLVTSSSTWRTQSSGIVETPINAAVFDRAYFIPLLSGMFKKEGLAFPENNFPVVEFWLFKKGELREESLQSYLREDPKMDSLNIHKNNYGNYPDKYNVPSFKYQEYGKYIHAPKGELVELQYVDVEKGKNMLTDKDLQIKAEQSSHGMATPIVALTSPLKSVTNYWMYTKKNGKLVLVWQKSEYGLDNGKTKVITSADKNVSVSLLLNDSSDLITSPVSSEASSSPISPQEKKIGFFTRIFQIILSWFK